MTPEELRQKYIKKRLREAYRNGKLTHDQVERAESLGIVFKRPTLSTINPYLAAQWHPIKNGDLSPEDVTAGSKKRVWWLGGCGHEWEAPIKNRNNGENCPYCANRRVLTGFNDLATTDPDLSNEWHPTKNGDLKPSQVLPGSRSKVWWLGKCGHEWEARIAERRNGSGCPYCANKRVLAGFNDLATVNPDLAAEWHPTKNGNLKPTDVIAGSGKKVWWRCIKGHEWETSVVNRRNGSGCPYCAKRTARTVMCIETKEIYDSIKNASRAVGLKDTSQVQVSLKDPTRTAYGYHWRYVEEDDSNG